MTIRKKQLIQERNILLERKYLIEQDVVNSGNTGTTQVTTTSTKKIDPKTLIDCSTNDSRKNPITLGEKIGEFQIFNTSQGKPFCTKKIKA
jgi:hypothetical protein